MEYPGFIGSDFQAQSFTLDQEHTINLYLEKAESRGATAPFCLLPTPGVTSLATFGEKIGRAHIYINGREFAVINKYFVEIDSSGTITTQGTVLMGSDPATISSNGDGGGQLFITAGSSGFIFDLATNVLTEVAFLVGKATMGGQIDGYFIALDASTSTFYISNLLDGLTWDPTQFAQRSKAPDRWVSMVVNPPYVWLFGTQTSEAWYDTGESPFPFAPYPPGFVPHGISAPFSATVVDGLTVWLGANKDGQGFVFSASGVTPEVVSSYSLQNALNGYTTVADALGFSYNDRGHSFYLLTFPAQDITWAYDVQMGQWHQRGTWLTEEMRFAVWRPIWHAFAFGEHRVLDGQTGNVYRMSVDIKTDVDGRVIRRLRRAPALSNQNARVFFPGLELEVDRAQALPTGQGSDPQIMLRNSNNHGQTWGAERWESLGKVGEHSKRVRWDRLGSGRARVVEVSFTDPCFLRLVAAYLTPDPYPLQQAG